MKKYSLYFMSLALIAAYLMVSVVLFFAVYIIAFSYHLGQNVMSLSAEISWLVYMILVGIFITILILKVFKEEKIDGARNISSKDINEANNN